MSRLRKGKKFKGGSFAETFKKGLSTNTPFAVIVPGMSELAEADGAAQAAAEAPRGNPADIIPSDTDYSKEEIGAYFQRRKLAKEQEEFEAKQKAAEEAANQVDPTTEAADASRGEQIGFDDDYADAGTKKEIRAEAKQNRKQIRAQKKDSKALAKQKKKDAKAAAKQLSGKDKRLAKKAARQGSRSDKKAIRQQKRSAKKANRKAKKRAKRGRK
tara:strand:+ start:90 stop:734 length:645 start_codon:yes stop_codon:yes gene_type:complete